MKTKFFLLIAKAFFFIFLGESLFAAPRGTAYLIFKSEETHSQISIMFYSKDKESLFVSVESVELEGKFRSGNVVKEQVMRRSEIEGADRFVYSYDLNDLDDEKVYQFRIGNEKLGFTDLKSFSTLSKAADEKIQLIQGGDMGFKTNFDEMVFDAKASFQGFNYDLILIGGDIAYANGRTKYAEQWDLWFQKMESVLVNKSGLLVPIIVAIGNHEVNFLKIFGSRKEKAPFFLNLFPQSKKTYFSRNLGRHSNLKVLDSGHLYKHSGKQSKWLEKSLRETKKYKNKLALYHIPLYPSHRDPDGKQQSKGREFWGPLFSKYDLTLAFENHDHAYKKTFPIKNGKVSSQGTIFVGDGCWGRPPRRVAKDRHYIEKSKSIRHFWHAELSSQGIDLTAIGPEGKVIDEFSLSQ